MNVTINDAINAFNLLREHMNENGFLYECYNLGISALKTVQDGNYQLPPTDVSSETLKAMASFNCKDLSCSECLYSTHDMDGNHQCMSLTARQLLLYEQKVKEVETWIKQNVMN